MRGGGSKRAFAHQLQHFARAGEIDAFLSLEYVRELISNGGDFMYLGTCRDREIRGMKLHVALDDTDRRERL